MPIKQASKYGAGRNGALFKAMAHPLKQRILVALDETQAHPAQLAARLDEDLHTVARLVRELANTDPPLIQEVAELRIRGGVAHVYKTIGRPVFELGPWKELPQLLREIQSTQAGQILLGDLAESIQARLFDARPERTMVREVGVFDEEGIDEVEEAGEAFLAAIQESEDRSAKRMIKSGEQGARISASALAFEVP
jgi:hypothetical protein